VPYDERAKKELQVPVKNLRREKGEVMETDMDWGSEVSRRFAGVTWPSNRHREIMWSLVTDMEAVLDALMHERDEARAIRATIRAEVLREAADAYSPLDGPAQAWLRARAEKEDL